MIENKTLAETEKIEIFVSDFDGVFTDGKLEVFSDGTTSKKMDYKDIMAIAILLKKGIKFAIISGENSLAIEHLKKIFPQIDIFQNERKKIDVLKPLLQKYNISPKNAIYVGDDINDTDCLTLVGHPYTVPNANFKIKDLKNIKITENFGGNGAIREITDNII